MSVGFVSSDPLDNLTNLYQRPIFIQANRIPTILDVYPAGTQWGDNVQPIQGIYETSGKGIWFLLAASSGGPLNTINGVAPVLSNINLVDFKGALNAGAIVITPVGAGTVGVGVKTDNTTVFINGSDQLSAGATVPTTFTEDAGSAVPAANNLNIFGTSVQGISTSGAGSTVTITAADATTAQKGVVLLATNAEAIAGADTAKAITSDDLKAKLGAQTQFAVGVGNTQTGAENWVGPGTDGQLLTGQTGANPQFALLTSPLGTVSIGFSAPNVTLDVVGGANPIEKVNLQTGTTPLVPLAGVVTFNGAVVAAGTNPVRTDGTAPNVMALEVQTSQAIAAGDATKIGLSNFDSGSFAVSGAGFVTLLNSVSGTATTVGAVTADLITLPQTSPQVTTYDILVVGNNTTDSTGVGYSIFGTVRSTGGAAFLVGVPDKISNEEAGSTAADANLIVSLNNGIVRVLGVAGKTINWKATARSVTV